MHEFGITREAKIRELWEDDNIKQFSVSDTISLNLLYWFIQTKAEFASDRKMLQDTPSADTLTYSTWIKPTKYAGYRLGEPTKTYQAFIDSTHDNVMDYNNARKLKIKELLADSSVKQFAVKKFTGGTTTLAVWFSGHRGHEDRNVSDPNYDTWFKHDGINGY